MRKYHGRFAPSPTGPLHFGSILTAIASWVDARSNCGSWQVRIDDLDQLRVEPFSIGKILRGLENLGLFWDGPIIYQSKRSKFYLDALDQLKNDNDLFKCHCSRTDILRNSVHVGVDGPVYPGTCRNKYSDNIRSALRVKVNGKSIGFVDFLCGNVAHDLETELGDFIVYRSDGVFSYHLANVVDDELMQITDIVRGNDLLASTSRQLYLIRKLNFNEPKYCHLPLAIDSFGKKLSKQTAVEETASPSNLIWRALEIFNQSPPRELVGYSQFEILKWATSNWKRGLIPRFKTVLV